MNSSGKEPEIASKSIKLQRVQRNNVDDDNTPPEAHKAILECLRRFDKQIDLARWLGIDDAHISNAKKGYISPMLKRALIKKELIPKPPPYPYYKIPRFRPKDAAALIVQNCGTDYARQLAVYISMELDQEDRDDQKL